MTSSEQVPICGPYVESLSLQRSALGSPNSCTPPLRGTRALVSELSSYRQQVVSASSILLCRLRKPLDVVTHSRNYCLNGAARLKRTCWWRWFPNPSFTTRACSCEIVGTWFSAHIPISELQFNADSPFEPWSERGISTDQNLEKYRSRW